ncbi:hypothetical protein ACEPAI_569 [Sanghuangporus weigelae]
MPSDIKFNSFGIPYLVDFASFSLKKKGDKLKRSKSTKERPGSEPPKPPPKSPSTPVRCPTCGHTRSHLAPARHSEPTQKQQSKPPRPGGLYIRFESSSGLATTKLSSRRLAKLRTAIEEAVMNAGMMKPSPDETGSAADVALDDTMRSRETARSDTSKKALFKGTYGQVKQALKAAGLVATPCSENGFENATRLGALFVVNSNAAPKDGLELSKLTLWG